MFITEISLGHSASQALVLVQPPNPSASIRSTIAKHTGYHAPACLAAIMPAEKF